MTPIENRRFLTTGEKALVVMVAAGVFGFWAGFNLSAPVAVAPFPVATAAARPVAAEPARVVLAPRAESVPVRDEPPIPTF